MITKKIWNSLTNKCRQELLEATFGVEIDYMPQHIKNLVNPYKHDFDYDIGGRRLKDILSYIYLKGKELRVLISIPVEYESNH